MTQFIRRGSDAPEVGPTPALDNGGRWHHIASEREMKRALGDRYAEILECPVVSLTFIVSHVYGCIIRTGAMGGDVYNVEGGWQYLTNIDLRADLAEIYELSKISVAT